MDQVINTLRLLSCKFLDGNSTCYFLEPEACMTKICRKKGRNIRGHGLPKKGWSADCGFCIRTWQHFNSVNFFYSKIKKRMAKFNEPCTQLWWNETVKQNTFALYINDPHLKVMNDDFLQEKHNKRLTFLVGSQILSMINWNGPHHGSILRRTVCKFAGL